MPRNSVIQHTLQCPPLLQEEVNQLIHAMLNNIGIPDRPLSEIITLQKLFFICHKTVDVLRKCETLEFIHDPDGVAIFGDLHGSLYDLFKGIKDAGWPTERTLIFLGDYIDRGQHPIELILFLFLLKLRYPKRVYILRGNHETMGQCYANQDDDNGLIQNIARYYPDVDTNLILFNINFVFDHLPLAAILSDQVLLCHGGISQFAKSRKHISQIPRPLSWLAPETNVFNISIMTDLLWADPSRDMTSKYAPSERGVSFFFSRRALKEKLRHFRCRALIRGHESNTSGFVKVFSGLCYTVHSSPAAGDECYLAAVLLVDFDEETKLLSGRAVYHSARGNLDHLREELLARFEEVRHLFPLSPPALPEQQCWSCCKFMEGVPHAVFKWQRCLSHYDCYKIMDEYRTGGHNFPFEKGFFSELEFALFRHDMPQLYKLSALRYPIFLNSLKRGNYISGIKADEDEEEEEEQEEEEESRHGFRFELPSPDQQWPFLEIID